MITDRPVVSVRSHLDYSEGEATAPFHERRDPEDAFWDEQGSARAIGDGLAIPIAVFVAALGGVALWALASRWRRPADHIVPSAADIHVRYPPPR